MKMQGNVWVARASPRARLGRVGRSVERTLRVQATTHAERAKSVASRLKIGASQ